MIVDTYTLGVFSLVILLTASLVLLRKRRMASDDGPQRKARWQQRQKAQAEFAMATEQAMLDLKNSVEGLATCMANLELRMRTVDQRQRKLDEQSAQLLRRRGFDEALNLVREGRQSSEIARRCAIPLAEVALLQRIHGQTTAQHPGHH